jgi:hypothetical protein
VSETGFSAKTETTLLAGDECGRTRIERIEKQSAFPSLTGSQTYIDVQLFHCIREPGHVGEHYAVKVKVEGATMFWEDDDDDPGASGHP